MLKLIPTSLATAALLTLAATAAAQDAAPVLPDEVCLTNACAEALKAKAAPKAPPPPTVLTGPPPNAPPGSFVSQFNGNSPALVRGRVLGIEWGDPNTYLRVADPDGTLYRVQGGPESSLSDQNRAALQAAVGQDVTVRGYNAWDASCTGGCLVNGRDVTLANGNKLLAPNPGGQAGTYVPQSIPPSALIGP